MRIKITKPGIYGANGKEIEVGTELTVKDEPKGWAGRYETISGKGEGKTPVTNPKPAAAAPKAPFEAKQKAAGWWAIFDADGNEVGKAFREDAAQKFNALDDADKQKAVDEHANADA